MGIFLLLLLIDIDAADSVGVAPLVDILNTEFASWPITDDSWDQSTFNPIQQYANLFTKGGVQTLNQIYVLPDDMNTDTTIIYVSLNS